MIARLRKNQFVRRLYFSGLNGLSAVLWSWVSIPVMLKNATKGLQVRWRYEYWRRQLGYLGEGTRIYGRIAAHNPENVRIGKQCTLNEGVMLISKNEPIIIGDHVRISAKALITSAGLMVDRIGIPHKHVSRTVTIEEGVWIGAGARIMPGVVVGRRSVIAAGSVVTKDVSPFTVVGGVPAKKIRDIEIDGNEICL